VTTVVVDIEEADSLPHGRHSDGMRLQTIWMTHREENPKRTASLYWCSSTASKMRISSPIALLDDSTDNDADMVEGGPGPLARSPRCATRLPYWQQRQTGWERQS